MDAAVRPCRLEKPVGSDRSGISILPDLHFSRAPVEPPGIRGIEPPGADAALNSRAFRMPSRQSEWKLGPALPLGQLLAGAFPMPLLDLVDHALQAPDHEIGKGHPGISRENVFQSFP